MKSERKLVVNEWVRNRTKWNSKRKENDKKIGTHIYFVQNSTRTTHPCFFQLHWKATLVTMMDARILTISAVNYNCKTHLKIFPCLSCYVVVCACFSFSFLSSEYVHSVHLFITLLLIYVYFLDMRFYLYTSRSSSCSLLYFYIIFLFFVLFLVFGVILCVYYSYLYYFIPFFILYFVALVLLFQVFLFYWTETIFRQRNEVSKKKNKFGGQNETILRKIISK